MAAANSNVETLTTRVVGGDPSALAEAFELFRARLKQSVAMRMDHRLHCRVDPSDVVQEAYLDGIRRIDEYAGKSLRMSLLLWLRLLTSQRLVDIHRQHLGAQMRDVSLEISLDQTFLPHASSVWLAERLIDQQETGSEIVMRAEMQEQLQKAFNEMEPLDREVLAMRHFELLSNQEVAQSLGISQTAASNRYIRALKRLQDTLEH